MTLFLLSFLSILPLTSSVAPPLGKYAVTGNHEVYAGMKGALNFLQQSGFTVLRNQRAVIQPGLSIVGVDDPATGKARPEEELFPAKKEGFTLLLKHRPLVNAGMPERFDLQLSGHAHRGQIFPFNLLTRLHYPQQDGLYPLAEGAWLYASRGTGTWGRRCVSFPRRKLPSLSSSAPCLLDGWRNSLFLRDNLWRLCLNPAPKI